MILRIAQQYIIHVLTLCGSFSLLEFLTGFLRLPEERLLLRLVLRLRDSFQFTEIFMNSLPVIVSCS